MINGLVRTTLQEEKSSYCPQLNPGDCSENKGPDKST